MTSPSPAPVDTVSAQELLKEATKLVSAAELEGIGGELEAKVARFRARLSPEALPALDEAGLSEVAGLVFSVRSKRRKLVADRPMEAHREAIGALLHGDGRLGERFDRFTDAYALLGPRRVRALASELLHFTDPARHWLWTPWIWDPATTKGALALVCGDDVDFAGGTNGEVYLKVGRATAALARDGQVVGYTRLGRGLLGTDVFLAAVQAVAMFTLYKLRISQEFLRFLPEFPEFTRRLLGVKHLAEAP